MAPTSLSKTVYICNNESSTTHCKVKLIKESMQTCENGVHENRHSNASSSSSENLDMNKEADRLKTFATFPKKPFLRPSLLALIGFYYTKLGDEVRCHFCKLSIKHWKPENDPVQTHIRNSTSCPLMRRRVTSNIPLDLNLLDQVLPPLVYDVCGHESINPGENDAKYAHFESKTERLDTFKEWPRALSQRSEELAQAGFFYTGRGDKVVCFSCGLGLKEWEQQDTAWEEHAKWSPECKFLIFVCGKEFVEEVQKQVNEMKLKESEPEVESNDKISNISEEKSDVSKDKSCKICLDSPTQVAFTPCGHAATCRKCAFSLKKCPICRSDIKDKIKLYFS